MKTLMPLIALTLLLHTVLASADPGGRMILNGQTEDCSLFTALNGSEAVPEDCKESTTRSSFTNQALAMPVVLQRVTFDFDSAHLTSDAQVDLSRVAKVMRDPVSKGQVYRVETHTEAQTNRIYAMALSKRRAEAVRNGLIALGVPPSQIVAEGKGSDNPVDPAHPDNPVNRRVEIINLSHAD